MEKRVPSVTLHKTWPIMCTILSSTEKAMRTPDRGLDDDDVSVSVILMAIKIKVLKN